MNSALRSLNPPAPRAGEPWPASNAHPTVQHPSPQRQTVHVCESKLCPSVLGGTGCCASSLSASPAEFLEWRHSRKPRIGQPGGSAGGR